MILSNMFRKPFERDGDNELSIPISTAKSGVIFFASSVKCNINAVSEATFFFIHYMFHQNWLLQMFGVWLILL